jgi:hypothetical protein
MDTFSDLEGPIEKFSWGKYMILGVVHSEHGKGVGKDIRIIGTTVTEWVERKGHILENAMITGVFDQDVEVLIIGIGVNNAIKVPSDMLQYIQNLGIRELILLSTPEACKKYNSLFRKGRKVALLAHGPC